MIRALAKLNVWQEGEASLPESERIQGPKRSAEIGLMFYHLILEQDLHQELKYLFSCYQYADENSQLHQKLLHFEKIYHQEVRRFLVNQIQQGQTKLCHHPPPSTTAIHQQPEYLHHHPPSPTTSQNMSTTTHTTHLHPKYIHHHSPPPTESQNFFHNKPIYKNLQPLSDGNVRNLNNRPSISKNRFFTWPSPLFLLHAPEMVLKSCSVNEPLHYAKLVQL